MNERNFYEYDPWDRDEYGTGSTKPPKSHRGLMAVLLVAVIVLGGAVSALGAMNVRLFQQLNQEPDDTDLSFGQTTAATGETAEPTQPSTSRGELVPPENGGDIRLELQNPPETVDNVPQQGGLSLQQIYTKAIDSVVSITCQLSGGTASGTGVVLSRDGYIITNSHVVAGAQSISVRLTDERQLTACLVGADAVSDLAVLYVQAQDLTPAEFGDSDQLRVGDAVAAIGDPLGAELRGTMTDGIVSAINRDVVTDGRTMTLIQTNAALNSGNSGGPLLNCFGQVIGINTLKISAFVDESGVEGLGFAIPSTTVKEVVDQLIAQGYVSGRPSLALEGDTVSALEQRVYRLPAGVLVSSVTDGGCAQQAGCVAGEVILAVGDTRVETGDALQSQLYRYAAGETVTLTIYRYRTGKQLTVNVTLDEAS